MFTTTMIDVANELGFPSYVFYSSGAACLASRLHPSRRHDRVCDTESVILGYLNPVPCNILGSLFDRQGFMPMGEAQAMEIAKGLEQCGHRFLWSARIKRPTSDDASGKANNCTNLKEILPQGFLERTKGRGLVCSWAPQIEVLATNPSEVLYHTVGGTPFWRANGMGCLF
ncbi:hypothetical protein DITRI_Ditri13aG0145400 [Diplodiscus trichospermus]